jgi:NADPH:quinone reductase
VVYDGVGKATFPASLDCLRPMGTFVSFGSASGPVAAFDLGLLAKGSLYATRPSLFTYIAKRRDYEKMVEDLLDAMRKGHLTIEVAGRFPLKDAATVHRALEGRQTIGSLVLTP